MSMYITAAIKLIGLESVNPLNPYIVSPDSARASQQLNEMAVSMFPATALNAAAT